MNPPIKRDAARWVLWAAMMGILFCPLDSSPENSFLEVGKFSASAPGKLPSEWKPLTFKKINRHTVYSLVAVDGRQAIRAVSEASASGLIRKIQFDPKDYPVVRWSWKVDNILQKGDVYRKEGDDSSARLYILFQFSLEKLGFFDRVKYALFKSWTGESPPLAAVNYIWARNAPKELRVPNPFTDRVIMIVVESGKERIGRWVGEERNIYEDYRRAFGEDPPLIAGVAIMTDTDNTGESAVAYYGDIIFAKASEP